MSNDCMNILVVHRQQEVIDRVKAALSAQEAVIRYSKSGLDGLLAARIENFDLIICSTDLPVITGFELVRSLKSYSVNKYTPIIFVADEVTDKVEYLGNALQVKGIYSMEDFNERLAAIINENAIVAPDVIWDDPLKQSQLYQPSQIA